MTTARQIQYVTIAGHEIPAAKAVCEKCRVLDLNTTFDTRTEPWIARCSNGHEWTISLEDA